ncbi:MAG: DUF6320 domain-containing protein [Bacillota bacterium]
MKYCNECKMSVSTDKTYCPLCGDQLVVVDNSPSIEFPKAKGQVKSGKIVLASRIYFGLALLATIVCAVVNIATFDILPIRWGIVAGVGSFYSWYLLSKCILQKGNATKILFKQLVTVSILLVTIDVSLTGFDGWSLYIAIPILAFSVGVSILVIALARLLHYREHLHYSLLSGALGSLQLVLLFFCETKWLIIASGLTNLAVLIVLYIFAQKSVEGEIVKRLHF